jgi:acetoin utilization deacetylase AcuC-like enzyme
MVVDTQFIDRFKSLENRVYELATARQPYIADWISLSPQLFSYNSSNKFNNILIVDLDVHQGNGSASIFNGQGQVFTFSMHGAKNYPFRKEASHLDIGLPDGTEDEAYLKILFNILPRVIDQHRPEIIFYQAGVDILTTDRLGRLSVSREGCRKRDKFVMEICKKNKIPLVVTMGGGYSPQLSHIIEAHANTFRTATEVYF